MENNGSSNFSVFTVLSHSKITAAKIAAYIKSVNGEELINCLGKLKEVRRSRVIHRAVWCKLYQWIVMQVRQPIFGPRPKSSRQRRGSVQVNCAVSMHVVVALLP